MKCENCGEVIEGKAVWLKEADGTPLCVCRDCANPDFGGLTDEELDNLIALEAEVREREERKFEILFRLEGLRADDPLWAELAERLGVR
ncbi:hypothetical protein BECAL_02987 [Bellilinea caldifistulae]|uniref:Uncharacterized protein n=1 Tax=Bellilinea caldifistulae TaxID=360411 RepID=A0A0N8GM83_9CHLR|nr:hypothetical protein [Bellilinea caldifistulae]KPL74578.1 hypothetical protein AC812_12345 [Bellilinea caldifistulae]GAP11793.1 hypothetical protein BECAL_02987 [Bellilinea caldifistulae]